MPLSTTQKGAIGQFAFLATSLATGKGELEVYSPAADNEGRDAEVRRHLKPALAIGVQEKVTFETYHSGTGSRARYLGTRFSIVEERVQNDPRLWYFFAVWGNDELRLRDPCFLVPAHVFHAMGRTGKRDGRIYFLMMASLSPDSHDRWSPFRVAPKDLGPRLLEIVDKTGLMASKLQQHMPADAVLHVLGYQFDGTSHEPLRPDGSPENWRCLRVSELAELNVLPAIWHIAGKRKGSQNCIDQVDVSAYRRSPGRRSLRRAA